MTLVFPNIPGRVAIIPERDIAGFLPVQLRMSTWTGPLHMRAIATQFTIRFAGQQQFLHSLRDFIYAYSFGEGIGQATLSGLAFADTCQQGQAAPYLVPVPGSIFPTLVDARMTGPEQIINHYDAYRMSRYGLPAQIVIGALSGRAFHAYLTGMSVSLRVKEQLNLSDFNLQFHVPPHTGI